MGFFTTWKTTVFYGIAVEIAVIDETVGEITENLSSKPPTLATTAIKKPRRN